MRPACGGRRRPAPRAGCPAPRGARRRAASCPSPSAIPSRSRPGCCLRACPRWRPLVCLRRQNGILPAPARTDTCMDRKLLDILACPATRQPLALLEARGLELLNAAIRAGTLGRADGSPQADPLREALVTRDRKLAYRIDDGIPVLLTEEGIATGQVEGFPKA